MEGRYEPGWNKADPGPAVDQGPDTLSPARVQGLEKLRKVYASHRRPSPSETASEPVVAAKPWSNKRKACQDRGEVLRGAKRQHSPQ